MISFQIPFSKSWENAALGNCNWYRLFWIQRDLRIYSGRQEYCRYVLKSEQ